MNPIRNFTISSFTCKDCGNRIPLPRSMGQEREFEHIKKLWCVTCQNYTNHAETRYCDIAPEDITNPKFMGLWQVWKRVSVAEIRVGNIAEIKGQIYICDKKENDILFFKPLIEVKNDPYCNGWDEQACQHFAIRGVLFHQFIGPGEIEIGKREKQMKVKVLKQR